jgi:hypothetical protein
MYVNGVYVSYGINSNIEYLNILRHGNTSLTCISSLHYPDYAAGLYLGAYYVRAPRGFVEMA